LSRDYPPDHEKQNPHSVDRHPRARVKPSRRFFEALSNFDNIEISKKVKANSENAPETAMSAALREAARRKAVAS
jgi:hypothetical protein